MDKEETLQLIDVNKIFKDKNPKLYNMLPGFVLGYIKRIIHQDEMNQILKKSEGLEGIEFAGVVLKEMGVNVSCRGLENIPATGPVIIASNHPLAGLDAMAMINLMGEKRRDLRFLVNDILTRLPNFGEVFVPVNKLGVNAKSNLVRIEEIYASDAVKMLFPAGMCSRIIDGKIQDAEWQKSFVTKAQKYQNAIIPVLVKGKNSPWFYNLSRFRTKLGIKANVEMFYLPDEMFKQKNKKIELIIGKPIGPEMLNQHKSTKEWASLIRSYVYSLADKPNQSFSEFIGTKK